MGRFVAVESWVEGSLMGRFVAVESWVEGSLIGRFVAMGSWVGRSLSVEGNSAVDTDLYTV